MLKVDGRDYTRKANYKLYFHCGPLKANLRIKSNATNLKKMNINLY